MPAVAIFEFIASIVRSRGTAIDFKPYFAAKNRHFYSGQLKTGRLGGVANQQSLAVQTEIVPGFSVQGLDRTQVHESLRVELQQVQVSFFS